MSVGYQDAATKNKLTLNKTLGTSVSPLTNRWGDINIYQDAIDTYLDEMVVAGQEKIDDTNAVLDKRPDLTNIRELIKTHGGLARIASRRKGVFKVVNSDLNNVMDLISYASILASMVNTCVLKGDLDPLGRLFRAPDPEV